MSFHVTFYPPTNESNYFISHKNADWLDKQIDNLSLYALTSIACFSLVLNLASVLVLRMKQFRSSLDRYTLYHCAFNSVSLSFMCMRPLAREEVTESAAELYFYIYLNTSVITCANLMKLALGLDRLSKMTNGRFRRLSPRRVLFMAVLLSFSLNAPVLRSVNILVYRWYETTYFEMVLNEYGASLLFGKYLILNALLIDGSIFGLLVWTRRSLRRAEERNLKSLAELIELERLKSSQVVITLSADCDTADEGDEERELDDEQPNQTLLGGGGEQSGKAAKAKHDPFEIENMRRRLCETVRNLLNVYLGGHAFFFATNVLLQVKYFTVGPIKVYVGYNYHIYIDLLNCVSNLLLYLCMSGNFFVLLRFNRRFREVSKYSFKRFFFCLFCCLVPKQRKPDLFKE
nr:G protein-coupled receptor [Proales similis]